jgi:hypothetical protein
MMFSLSVHDLTLTVDHHFQAMVIGIIILIRLSWDSLRRLI